MCIRIKENDRLSVEGRILDVNVFGSGNRTVLLMAGIHGDELSGIEALQNLSDALSRGAAQNLGELRLVLLPIANPDGYEAGTRKNARGVDLNRNFPARNWTKSRRTSKYYGGPLPASEPETQALMRIIDEYQPALIISLHDPLGCVNYNGPCQDIAERISEITGLSAVNDIGYPCPGSMGTYYGSEGRVPLITLELPRNADPAEWAAIILQILRALRGDF